MNIVTHKTQTRFKKKYIFAAIALLIILGGSAYLWHRYYKPASLRVTRSGNFSGATSPTNSASSPPPKKQPISNSQRIIGGGTDTKGQTTSNTNSSQWITASSGNITIEQPIANTTLQNGSTLSGTAKISTIHFRLIDNAVGVISEGTLSVVNGKFSGSLSFTPHSPTGQLDVFDVGTNGVELDEIQIAVKFQE